MNRYQIKVNTAGSWANLVTCPPDRLDACKAACETLAHAHGGSVSYKVVDAASGDVFELFCSKPRKGEPHGWHRPKPR